MKLKYLTLLMIALVLALPLRAGDAKKFTLSGTVLDGESQSPLEYATVTILDAADQVVNGAVTDAQGKFALKIPEGSYKVRFSFISYKTAEQDVVLDKNTDLPPMALQPDATQLDDVEIVDEKTQVEFKLDKKIYNIGKDITVQGGTVNDVLDNVPSVNVDASGAISLRGNGGVTVLINGKPSVLAANNGLASIPAQNVEKVEVVTNPSARYQAAGTAGIINIVLKRNRLKGFSGSVQLTTGIPADHSATANLAYKTEKMNLFGTFGRRYSNFVGKAYTRQSTQFNGTTTALDMVGEQDRNDNGYNFFFGSDFYINPKNTLTATFFHFNMRNTDKTVFDYLYTFDDGTPDSSTQRTNNYVEPQKYSQLELSYTKTFAQKRRKWSVDFQYDFWNDDENENIDNILTGEQTNLTQLFRTRDIESSDDFMLQTDYVHPIGKEGQFEIGGRAETRVITSNYTAEEYQNEIWDIYNGINNDVDYAERIGGAYIQYGNAIKKFSYLFGLRTEYTGIEVKDVNGTFNFTKEYTRLFPTAHLSYGLGKGLKAQMSYSRRIRRPSFWQLNPFGGISDNNSLFAGNPDLDPAFTNALELTLLQQSDKLTVNPSLYFQHTTDNFQFNVAQASDGTFLTLPFNMDHENRFGAELLLMYRPTKWLQLQSEFNYFRFQQRGDFGGQNFDFDYGTWSAEGGTRMRLPAKLSFQANFSYQARNRNAQTLTKAIYNLDLGLSKRLLKDKATLAFNVRNALDSRRQITLTTGETFSTEQMRQRNIRRFRLAFTYQWNQRQGQRQRQPGRSNR